VDPLPELLAALRDHRSWGGTVANRSRGLVSLRETPQNGDLLVHPLAQLSVRQRVVPLDIEIARFGNTIPSGERRFRITRVQLGGRPVDRTRTLTDFFAPGQFLHLTDAQVLSRPSFEQLDSGLELAGDSVSFGGQDNIALLASADATYETVTVSPGGGFARPKSTAVLADSTVLAISAIGASGRSAARGPGSARYRGSKRDLAPKEPRYTIAGRENLTAAVGLAGLPAEGTSYTVAQQALANLAASNARLRNRLNVVAWHELTGAGT
jgi:hypothetical protein